MRLKLTLARPSGSSDDIAITTDAAASISDVAGAVKRLDPHDQSSSPLVTPTLMAALPGQPEALMLPPEAPIGEAWIGSGATVSIVDAQRHYSRQVANAPTLATVKVLDGPDAGREFPLTQGTAVLGREEGCDIVLTDRLISKRHVRFEVSTVVEVVDLGSANGVIVDGGLVTRLRIENSETLLIGDSHVLVTVVPTMAAVAAPPTAGPIPFNRSPRVESRYAGQEFSAPEVPAEKDPPPFPWLAMLTPFLLGGAMFALTKNPTTLLFCLLSPLMMIGNFATAKTREKRRLKRSIERFDEHLASLTEQLETERVRERELRLLESPSTAEALAGALQRSPLLWTRRPEHWSFLNVRLGIGTMTSRNTVKTASRGELLKEFQDRLDAVVNAHRTIDGVPLIDNLFDAGALGVAGTPLQAVGSVNSLLVQLTALHSPAELVVASLVTPRWSGELSWLKWMPHTTSQHSPIDGSHLADSASSAANVLGKIEAVIEERLAKAKQVAQRGAVSQTDAALERGADVGKSGNTTGVNAPVPAIVVLISDDVDVERARLVQLAERAADAGVYPVWLATDVPSLPAACRTYLEVGNEPGVGTVGFVRLGETITDVAIELVSREHALDYAKRMAAVIDAGALVEDASDLPRSISLVTLLGHELVETSEAVVDRWRQNSSIHDRTPGIVPAKRRAGTLRAVIGSAGVDAMHLDLRTQGPHALVGGTTGAGKSEFLQAWVLGMAAEYSPDRVTFLFIDYKGGSAFAECVNLPHCVGLVTDLSPHLVRRALTSLRAELHHREHLLNRKKAKDLLELEKRGDPESPPALVLVIDEFAALVGEVPEFVDGVVDIAQRGRSLGIHLIMATQRPAGVIKDNLRANTNLRVALRMADESDSQDVVGVTDAAHFDPSIPGRGLAKTGPGRLAQFQSGYAGGWTTREPERADIEVAELRFGGEVKWEDRTASEVKEERDLGPTDQQRLVASIVAAQRDAEIPNPRRPWLDELAAVYDLGMLRQRTDSELLLGVTDVPERQRQVPVYFHPDVDGHLAVYGTGGSGKSAVLRTLADSAAITPRGGPVHVYALDFGAGSLRMLEQLPHVGSVINGDDSERVIRLFRTLKGELESRAPRYAEANASNVTEYRSLTGRYDEPRIVLLVDGFANFRNDYEIPAGRSQWFEVFKDILSDGRQLGMHVAVTADRAGAIPASISSSIQRRVVLRLADDGYGMLDVPSDILGAASPPGRAIVDGLETQIAILGGSSSVSEQSTATRKLGEAMQRAGVTKAPEIGSLPKEYVQSELPTEVSERPVIGVSDTDLGPFAVDPSGVMLLAGPPASGRTTALQALSAAFARWNPASRRYYIGNARSPLSGLPGWHETATTVDEIAALAKGLAAAVADIDTEGRIAVFIESLGDFLQTPADAAIVELTRAARRSDHFVVAEAETSAWGSSWPLFGEFKNSRRGLLLQPESVEGDLILKTSLPRMTRSEFPPGRAVYIAKGAHVRVQLPLPE